MDQVRKVKISSFEIFIMLYVVFKNISQGLVMS